MKSLNEEFYDSQIAPDLMRLAKLCEDRGMAFVACVEYQPGETSETAALPAGAGIKPKMTYWAMRSHGNIDSFMIAVERHARMHGHSSAYLHMRGIPTSPLPTGEKP